MRISIVLFAVYLTVACAYNKTLSIPIEFGDRQTLFFAGKGAAAGIMMDAYLGGAGVAIGIAIDEGIAKDIAVAIQKANPGFDIRDVVSKQLVVSGGVTTKNWQSVVIEKYGFKVVDGDFVSPVLELTLNCKGGAEAINFESKSINSNKAELELVKKDGEVGLSLLQQAVAETIQTKNLGALCGARL